MAKIAGRFSQIYYAGYDLTGRMNQYDFDLGYAELDTTDYAAQSENSQPDIQYCLAVITSFMDAAVGSSMEALKSPGGYTDKALMILIGGNAAPVIGDVALCMLAKEFNYKAKAAIKSMLLATSDFKSGVNQADETGIVQANTTITNTTTFASVNNGAASANGADGYLEVLTPTVADSYVVKIQHSVNDSTYVDLMTFAANGQTRTSEMQSAAGTVNQYTRGLATRTGSAGNNFQLALVCARNN